MADRAVIDVDVNAEQFTKFTEMFERYQKSLQDSLETWKKINQENDKSDKGGGGGRGGGRGGWSGKFFGFDNRMLERSRNEIDKIMHGFRDLERMAKPGGALYGLIGTMPGGAPGLQALTKLGLIGPIGAGLAMLGGGMAAAIAMAPGAADERRRTLGLGVGVAQARGFQAGMGMNILGDPGQALSAMAKAQFEFTSQQRQAMNMLFGAQGAKAELQKDRMTAMFDIMEALQKRLKTYSPEMRETMARPFESLIPYGDLQAWMSATPEKQKEMKADAMKAAQDAENQAKQVQDSTDKLTKLNASVQRVETSFSNMATDLAAKFVDPLVAAADAVSAAFNKVSGLTKPYVGPNGETFDVIPGKGIIQKGGKQSWLQQFLNNPFGGAPATPGNAAWTPGPTAYAMGGGADGEWMKKWFMEESAATKSAAQAAEKRDQQITNLLDYLIGHKGGTAAAAGAIAGINSAIGGGSGGGGGLTFGNATGSIMPKGGGMFSRTDSLFSGSGSTVASGNLKKNQDEAYAAAKAAGLSDTAARALVANFSGESLRDPSNTTGDKGQAQGIGQWHHDRAQAIFQKFGKYPAQMSVAEQTKAAIWEMQTNPAYKQSWAALQGGGSAENMVGTLVRNYERPGDPATATAQRMRFLHGLNVGGVPGAPSTKTGDVISSQLTDEQKAFFAARGASPEQMAGVRPEFANRLIAGIKASEGATGDKAHFESLFRSYEKQKDIYEHPGKYGATVVARPGTSPHEKGIAADIGRTKVSQWLTAHAKDYGLETVSGDPGHFQLGGARKAMHGPMAMDNWQAPDRKNRFTVNSNFGADINVQAATLVS